AGTLCRRRYYCAPSIRGDSAREIGIRRGGRRTGMGGVETGTESRASRIRSRAMRLQELPQQAQTRATRFAAGGFNIARAVYGRSCYAACFCIVEGSVPEEWRYWYLPPLPNAAATHNRRHRTLITTSSSTAGPFFPPTFALHTAAPAPPLGEREPEAVGAERVLAECGGAVFVCHGDTGTPRVESIKVGKRDKGSRRGKGKKGGSAGRTLEYSPRGRRLWWSGEVTGVNGVCAWSAPSPVPAQPAPAPPALMQHPLRTHSAMDLDHEGDADGEVDMDAEAVDEIDADGEGELDLGGSSSDLVERRPPSWGG
ncbi:hypothetical protein C8F04DRAFT_1300676, partial [Mycena alexandri]